MTDSQLEAISSDHSRILVVAGPGSGKTETLTKRAMRFTDKELVIITYTNAAAGELRERVKRASFIGTIHSWIYRLLRTSGSLVGLPKRLSVLSAAQQYRFLCQVLADMKLPGKLSLDAAAESVKKSALLEPPPPPRSPDQLFNIEYHRRLLSDGMLTFDMILHLGMRLAKKYSQCVADHLLIDEYQDTTPQIHAMCQTLNVNNRFYVGDPDQAIFQFNGGSVQPILELSRSWEWEVHVLEENFRSGPGICKAANAIISTVKNRHPKQTRPVPKHGKVRILHYGNLHQEREAIAKSVLKDGPENCAVLCRTNFLVDAMASHLADFGLSIRKLQYIKLPEDWALLRMMSSLCSNPQNDYLAYEFLAMRNGAKFATDMKREALATGKSINSTVFKFPVAETVADVIACARNERLNSKVIALASTLVEPDAPVGDLAIAMDAFGIKEQGEGVTVTTIHAAKGREWPNVFVAHCVKQTMDSAEDEARLLYVAVTRASRKTAISFGRHGTISPWMENKDLHPSKLIQIIPKK